MNRNTKILVDPSAIDPEKLDGLLKVLQEPHHPALVSEQGLRTEIPQPVFETLLKTVQLMREGHRIVLVPEDEAFTTQAAADYLGVSRQFLVNVLKEGEIPYHYVGTHRRVLYKDLLAYDRARQKHRRESLRNLSKRLVSEGVYDADVIDHDAG